MKNIGKLELNDTITFELKVDKELDVFISAIKTSDELEWSKPKITARSISRKIK